MNKMYRQYLCHIFTGTLSQLLLTEVKSQASVTGGVKLQASVTGGVSAGTLPTRCLIRKCNTQ